MLLTIDIGNTHITMGVFTGESLGPCWRMATARERTGDEYGLQLLGFFLQAGVAKDEIAAVAIASVVPPLTGVFVQACRDYLQREALVVDAGFSAGVWIWVWVSAVTIAGSSICRLQADT